jgi:hypothetical protein
MKAVTYTLPATADNEIVQTVADLSVARFPGEIRSIVLTGRATPIGGRRRISVGVRES